LIKDCGEQIDQILDKILAKNFVKTGRLLQVSLDGRDGFHV
jgi:hypothetical protein